MSIRKILFNKISFTLLVIAILGGGIIAWQQIYGNGSQPKYRTTAARIGNVTESVSANGTVNPVVLVNVGTQDSGTVMKLHVDFNDHVKQGQILLELDPAVLTSQVLQTEASLASAHASLDLANANEARARSLFHQEYISRQDYDQAEQASKSAQAQVAQIHAQLAKDKTNLAYTIIRSPVAGVVVSRAVDLGQTVAASFQTPTLFQIAQDLRKMQIYSSFAEADIGNIKVGQPVQFTVDAFPNRTFNASVRQIRLNATTQQNVVTYNVVVAVDNPDEILLPGMTTYVNVIIARKNDVLLIPTAALRFRPAVFSGTDNARRARPDGKTEGTPQDNAGGVVPADESGGSGKRARPTGISSAKGAEGADGQRAAVYVLGAGQLHRIAIRPGISDGRFTEVIAGDIKPGDQIVTGVIDLTEPGGSAQGAFRMRLF